MTITDWQAFYDSLVIQPSYGQPVPKPTPAQLDKFEAETGFRLPRSYRDYILVFGPGEFPCVLKIAAPGYDYLQNTFDLQTAGSGYGYGQEELIRAGLPPEDQQRMGRLVYFGLHHSRQWLGWDPQDMREAEAPEYGIYRVDWVSDGAEFVATSFRQLVEETCEELFAPDPDYDEESMGPQRGFMPATWVPESERPA